MARVDQFQKFGKLRNQMIHFGVPDADTRDSLKFLFEVMEPLVREFWQDSIIPYAKEWDEVLMDGHLEDVLTQSGIEIPPDLRGGA